ncbi:cell surface hyaluronidase-like [Amphibalanus amphitrite]|uniref:cell surface hyaluronidase-like n=1 Tax=Amphibalanus amphitrite TaxID=1232801 RepID=UPI001C92A1EB|nr:cell surface hyaluronidase-like [Amphibalanus amphitrite]
MYEFDSFGNPVRNWGVVLSPWTFVNVMRNIGNVVIIVVSRWARFGEDQTPTSMGTVFAILCYNNTRSSSMLHIEDSEKVAFAAICHIGFPGNSTEMIGQKLNGRSQTGRLMKAIGNVEFSAISVVSLSGLVTGSLAEMASYFIGNVPPLDNILDLADSVESWRPGDRIVVASTDFHFNQAEEFDIVECAECDEHQVKIMGPVWYTHWGEVTDGVDMRAEVGILTRNVKIRGEVADKCYGGKVCERYNYDTFGGQIRILKNFTSVRIENAELFHMGQQEEPGSHPIHFHMCLDVSHKHAYIRSNSIHNTFSRCVAIHGTHNLTVSDNVAYDHLGHCFFLGDGGEQDNRLIGNLGLGTKPGSLLPSDISGKVSTFWITNPDNELVDNSAAGSDGNGIWILMPQLPIGLSASVDMGLVRNQTARTAVKRFRGNVAHSNKRFGLRLDDELRPDGSTTPIRYIPLRDPTDPESDLAQLRLDNFTAYKNTQGVWLKSMWTLCTNFRLAENGIGIIFASSEPDDRGPHHEVLENSRVVGETNNIGEPAGRITLQTGHVVQNNRSLPRLNAGYAQVGVAFYRGPVHVISTSFAGFQANVLRPAGAIGKKFSNRYFSSPVSSIRNVTFDFVDPLNGTRFYDGDDTIIGFDDRDGNRHSVVLDWDGSLTTYPLSSVVRPIPLLVNARCVLVPSWGPGTAICPDRFTRLRVSTSAGLIPTLMTRNDLMASETEVSHFEKQISYSLNTQESYILHFNNTVPKSLTLSSYGLDLGLSQNVGICVGVNQTLSVWPLRYASVADLDELKADERNSKYFYDSTVGVIFFRFSGQYPRDELTMSNCPGEPGHHPNGVCEQRVTITLQEPNDGGDCRESAYPKYRREPTTPEGALTIPDFIN